jgi:hypothetical protein
MSNRHLPGKLNLEIAWNDTHPIELNGIELNGNLGKTLDI